MARLRLTVRFTYAFHAREVRFECDRGEGFARLFPETYSFHAERHDPAELYLQFDDLLRKPRLLSPRANRRDMGELMSRLLSGIPRYLERTLTRLETDDRIDTRTLLRVYEDISLIAQILSRFIADWKTEERREIRAASYHLRKLELRALLALVRARVTPDYLAGYVIGSVDPVDPSDDPSEAGFFYTLEGGDEAAVNRCVTRRAELAFYRWLEDVCLDESNRAFEVEDSPFEDRESEVLKAIVNVEGQRVARGQDLSPFLRRPNNKDCMRVLKKLETWFLRQYDVYHAAAAIHHADHLARGFHTGDRRLSTHTTTNYLLLLAAIVAPFVGAAFAYERAPRLFDLLASGEVVLVYGVAAWFLGYRFCWQRDLTYFHSSVPRIGAGIIVGYLPVFLIDEVWDMSERSWASLLSVAVLLGFVTLLYIYVEVQRRLGDPGEAFARARHLVLLGLLQACVMGFIATTLVGSFMAVRNWSPDPGLVPIGELGAVLPFFIGELPMVLGIEPFVVFPSAVFIMTFLSFFIGTFLQLLWEDLAITEPL